MKHIINEFDEIVHWPKKLAEKVEVIHWLGTKFNNEINYSEKDINKIIKKHHTFDDIALLRTELILNNIPNRTKDGSNYWKVEKNP